MKLLKRLIHSNRLPIILAILFVSIYFTNAAPDSVWKKVDDGLFIGEFLSPQKSVTGDSKIIIVRIDPQKYELKLLTASEYKHSNLTVNQWCQKYNLIAGINAGMFQGDYSSNVGFMKNFNHTNNSRINSKYLSVAAFNPVDKSNAGFRIFDIDETKMKDILNNYRTVIQNLRLIKRPGKNRWSQQSKKWSEAALGQDREGNILFIFSRSPFSMHDLNKILLKLPIRLVCAQHLEGGPEASLFFSHNGKKLELVGSFETGFNEDDENTVFWPIPNVLGIIKRN